MNANTTMFAPTNSNGDIDSKISALRRTVAQYPDSDLARFELEELLEHRRKLLLGSLGTMAAPKLASV